MEMDLVVGAKREHRYNEISELIGQLTLIEKYIRIRLCNGTLHKDEDALHILLDLHRDAVFEIGMNLNSLKIIDSEEEEDCVEDDDECDMRAEDDENRKTINCAKDADETVEPRTVRIARQRTEDECVEDVVADFVCKPIHDIDILRELYSAWLNYCDVCSFEKAMFLHCGKFYITFERDIDNLESTHTFVPHYIFENHQDEYVHYACFDEENFHKLTQRIEDKSDIEYNIIILNNNTIATRLNYD